MTILLLIKFDNPDSRSTPTLSGTQQNGLTQISSSINHGKNSKVKLHQNRKFSRQFKIAVFVKHLPIKPHETSNTSYIIWFNMDLVHNKKINQLKYVNYLYSES